MSSIKMANLLAAVKGKGKSTRDAPAGGQLNVYIHLHPCLHVVIMHACMLQLEHGSINLMFTFQAGA
jgi:hypothetical protein